MPVRPGGRAPAHRVSRGCRILIALVHDACPTANSMTGSDSSCHRHPRGSPRSRPVSSRVTTTGHTVPAHRRADRTNASERLGDRPAPARVSRSRRRDQHLPRVVARQLLMHLEADSCGLASSSAASTIVGALGGVPAQRAGVPPVGPTSPSRWAGSRRRPWATTGAASSREPAPRPTPGRGRRAPSRDPDDALPGSGRGVHESRIWLGDPTCHRLISFAPGPGPGPVRDPSAGGSTAATGRRPGP